MQYKMRIFLYLILFFSFPSLCLAMETKQRVDNKMTGYLEVSVTAYSPSVDECDADPFITASNTRVRKGIIALSRDLERDFKLKFGDVIILKDIGEFEFQDRMNRRWKRRVDIFFWTKKECWEFGNKKAYFKIKSKRE